MEKLVTMCGFGIFCLFFMIGFVVSNAWLLGCLAGFLIMAFGWLFWED